MTEEDFLARWSRRKREADVAKADPPAEKPADQASDAARVPAQGGAVPRPQPEFDITTLPPIDSITSVSDVTAFLRAGVPADLTRAALRRVWTADPAIRDFVGLAENAWDFTDPNAMPGFGPLEATEEVRRMIAQVVNSIGQSPTEVPCADAPRHAEVARNSSDSNEISDGREEASQHSTTFPADQEQQIAAQDLSNQVMLQSTESDIAAQHDDTEAQEKPKQSSRRQHGGALPR
jgi:hypothetical protein